LGHVWAAWTARPQFEAATVKVNRDGGPNGFFPSPGRLRANDSTLQQPVLAAYHVGTEALVGAGGWIETERYDIQGET